MPSFFDSAFSAGPMVALMCVHGESLLVQTSEDPEPRTITAICKLNPEYGNVAFASDGETDMLTVECFRHATTGIVNVELGDKVWYGGDEDRPYTFRGEKQGVRPDRWTLVFVRKRQMRQGARE